MFTSTEAEILRNFLTSDVGKIVEQEIKSSRPELNVNDLRMTIESAAQRAWYLQGYDDCWKFLNQLAFNQKETKSGSRGFMEMKD